MVYHFISLPPFDFQYTILHRGMILSIRILLNHANWFYNDYLVKMASSSVKCSADCVADSGQRPTNLQNKEFCILRNDKKRQIHVFV
jgi:hypothetical protein